MISSWVKQDTYCSAGENCLKWISYWVNSAGKNCLKWISYWVKQDTYCSAGENSCLDPITRPNSYSHQHFFLTGCVWHGDSFIGNKGLPRIVDMDPRSWFAFLFYWNQPQLPFQLVFYCYHNKTINDNVFFACYLKKLEHIANSKEQKIVTTNLHECTYPHKHPQSVWCLDEVRFQLWSERCECVWWPNFSKETVPDRKCSIKKKKITEKQIKLIGERNETDLFCSSLADPAFIWTWKSLNKFCQALLFWGQIDIWWCTNQAAAATPMAISWKQTLALETVFYTTRCVHAQLSSSINVDL